MKKLLIALIVCSSHSAYAAVTSIVNPSATLSDGSVTTAKLGSDAVTSNKILSGSVTTAKLSSDVRAQIANAGGSILDDSITTDKLSADTITSVKILTGAVTTPKIGTDAVAASAILSSAVTSSKIASDAVVTAGLLNAAVTTPKLASDSVSAAKILSGAVTTAKLANDSVTSAAILSASITTAKLNADLQAMIGGGSGGGITNPYASAMAFQHPSFDIGGSTFATRSGHVIFNYIGAQDEAWTTPVVFNGNEAMGNNGWEVAVMNGDGGNAVLLGPSQGPDTQGSTIFGAWHQGDGEGGAIHHLDFGGDAWGHIDQNIISFWTSAITTETIDQGVERMVIDSTGTVHINIADGGLNSLEVVGPTKFSGTGSPTTGYGLCLTAGGLLGHCTSVLGAGGDCTCVSP